MLDHIDSYLHHAAHAGHAPLWLTFVIAALLGLRHATDPDHLAAVSTLVAHEGATPKEAGRVGFTWGLGHGIAMMLFGLPVIIAGQSLPESVYKMAEAAVGVLIIYFSVQLLGQAISGDFHTHTHRHPHDRALGLRKTRWRSFGVGMVHGLGGSYAGALLLLTSFGSAAAACIGLAVFSVFCAVSMTGVTALFAVTLTHHRLMHVTAWILRALAVAMVFFGVLYLHQAVSS